MINLGTVKPGSTIYIPFETFGNTSPAPITITGLATSDIKVFKNGSTTERASASGFTLLDTDGIDFGSLTGIHGVSIDLSDNATADFWTAGGKYFVVIGDITVDSLTMRFIPVMFEIGYSGAILDTTIATLASQTSFTLTAGPAEANALVGCTVLVHDLASAVQIAMGTISAYAATTRTVTLAVDPAIFTMAAGDNISIMPRTNMYSVNGAAVSTVDLSTDLTEILDRLGYLLARDVGAVPNAQTTAPVYTITRSGNTFTVTLGGCTSAGIRTAPTLGKT